MEEYLDLVDDQNNVIGSMARREVHAKKLRNFRGVTAFIKNSEGKLLIMRRSHLVAVMPSGLDASMSGHVSSGEDYDTTFKRELAEELRLDADTLNWRALGTTTPHEHGSYGFSRVYEIASDDVPNYNPEDYSEHYWLFPAEVKMMLDNGEKALSIVGIALHEFYESP